MNENCSAGRSPRKKKIIVCPAGVCIICNSGCSDLRDFQTNRLRNGKIENYMQALFICYNINVFNPQLEVRESKICRDCIRSLREALTFKKVVREAQERLQDTFHVLLSDTQTIKKECPDEQLDFKPNTIIKKEKKGRLKRRLSALKHKKKSPKIIIKREIKDEIKHSNYSDDVDNDESFFDNYSSDGESSTTSEQMRIATGYKEIIDDQILDLPEPVLDPTNNTCPTCGKIFGKFRYLQRHYETHSTSLNYLCHICGKAYAMRDTCNIHILTHSSRAMTCKICKAVCTNSRVLSTHIRTHHCEKYIYSCTECDEKFRSSIVRRKHVYFKHPHIEVNPFPCATCGKQFFGDAILRSHMRLVHDKVKEFSCAVCGRDFSWKKGLKAHMTIHTGIKDFKCTQCGNAFALKKTLTEHLKIHANIRNYKCDLCEKSFIHKCSLESHMKTHTKNYF